MDDIGRLGIAQEIVKKHCLLAAEHRASRRNWRSHFVVCLPAFQLFPAGGLHMVGIDRTRRRQQQKEEALQLAVCGLWRPRESFWRTSRKMVIVLFKVL